MMIDTGLQDKVVLVTGANSPHGIGAATARAFAAQGAAVFITYLRLPAEAASGNADEDVPGEAFYERGRTASAHAVVQAIREQGGRAEAWETDLADPSVIPQLFDWAEATFGPVEVLVNNAAHSKSDTLLHIGPEARDWMARPTQTVSPESHDRHFAVNSRAVALMMAEFAHRHAERGARWGRIVNVSTDGAPGFAGEVSYGASKAALESYSRAAAHEFAPLGITVNIVSPGPIQTGWISPDWERAMIPSIPLSRLGRPDDVADVIVFLASEQARWLTGQLIHVGGGHRMI